MSHHAAMKLRLSLDYFLVFIPVSIVLRYFVHTSDTWVFVSSCLAIIPLAKWLGVATEHIADKAGEGVGGLLNATFGNAAELIIALVALRDGLFDVVKASITGSIIGNVLLVMGASFVAGGSRFKLQKFNIPAVHAQTSMLLLAAISLIIPAVFHHLAFRAHESVSALATERNLSVDIAIILLVVYVLSLVFSLGTHKRLYSSAPELEDRDESHKIAGWSNRRSVTVLLVATFFIAWLSEMLVGSVESAAHALGMSGVFIGIIVVAIVGNAAEHSTAVLMAIRNRMDMSIGIAVGSSIQIALFVAPVLVLLSYLVAPRPLDLVFSGAEVIAITLTVLIATQVTGDGRSNWFEGAQLIAVYLILGVMFYFLPAEVPGQDILNTR